MKVRITMDPNGNKVVKIPGNSAGRGFSIQTNGILPALHKLPTGSHELNEEQYSSLLAYVADYENRIKLAVLLENEKRKSATVVIFRVWKEQPQSVIALFPYIDEDTGYCLAYEHTGQHGPADYNHCMSKTTRPAKPEEYAELKAELEQIGYRLDIRKRANPRTN